MNTQALRAIAIDPDVVDRDYAPTIISAAAKIETDAKVIADLAAKCEVEFQARVEQAKVIAALREALQQVEDAFSHPKMIALWERALNLLSGYDGPSIDRIAIRAALAAASEQSAGDNHGQG